MKMKKVKVEVVMESREDKKKKKKNNVTHNYELREKVRIISSLPLAKIYRRSILKAKYKNFKTKKTKSHQI